MATRSRTYDTTDWQVWTYVPQSGALRLDFSKWDDGSTWGSTGGSYEPIDLPIISISIDESAQPSSGISQISAGTASISLEIQDFSKDVVKEFYTGKPVYITLKNEETARTHAVFGQATPIFSGYISSSSVNYNKFDLVQTLDFTVTDSMQYLLNSLVTVNKNARGASYYKFDDIDYAVRETSSPDRWPIDCLYSNANMFTLSSGTPDASMVYETSGEETATVGTWVQDLVNTFAGKWVFGYKYEFVDVSTNQFLAYKRFSGYLRSSVDAFVSTAYAVMELDKLYAIQVGNSIPDKPSVFELTTDSGSSYSVGTSTANSVNQVISYSQSYDSPISDLSKIATSILSLENYLSPIGMSFEVARQYQPITFDNRLGSKYLLPYNFVDLGMPLYIDITSQGFEAGDCYAYVTGRTITVTPDTFTVDYKLIRTK